MAPGTSVTTAITPRTYENTGNGLGVLRDSITGPSPKRGDVIDLEIRRPTNWPKISRAIARGLPGLGTAIAVAEILEEVRCQYNGGPECDLGQPEVPQTGWSGANGCTGTNPVSVALCSEALPDQLWRKSWGTLPSGWSFREIGTMTCTAQTNGQMFCNGTIQQVVVSGSVQGQYNYGVTLTPETIQACPQVTIGGVSYIPVKGPDGQCPTGNYVDVDATVVEDRVNEFGNKNLAAQAVPELIQLGVPIEHDPPTIFLPNTTVLDGRTTTTNPDGSTTVVDRSWILTPTSDGYTWAPRALTRTYAPGETIPPPGSVPTNGSTVTEGQTPGSGTGAEVITCGLPGTPPCKIDETGTPSAGDDSAARSALEAAGQAAIDKINEATTKTLPWVWGFSLPGGACSNWEIPANGVLPAGSVDICGTWIAQFWRDLWAWALAVFAGWYAWRRYSDAVGAS